MVNPHIAKYVDRQLSCSPILVQADLEKLVQNNSDVDQEVEYSHKCQGKTKYVKESEGENCEGRREKRK